MITNIGKSTIVRCQKMIYRHRKIDLPMLEIRISDINKLAGLPISVNQNQLPISEIRTSKIGKQPDLPISENGITDIGK